MISKIIYCPHCGKSIEINWSPGMTSCRCDSCAKVFPINSDYFMGNNHNQNVNSFSDSNSASRNNSPNSAQERNTYTSNNQKDSVRATCPICKKELMVNPNLEASVCVFCKSPFIVTNAIREHSTSFVNSPSFITTSSNSNYLIPLLWILGIIFIFPIPLTIFILKKNNIKKDNKVFIIGGAWVLYLMVTSLLFPTLNSSNRIEKIAVPQSSYSFQGMYYSTVQEQLKDSGFNNIEVIKIEDLDDNPFDKDGSVETVTIDGNSDFRKGKRFPYDAKIKISYHTYPTINAVPVDDTEAIIPISVIEYSGKDYKTIVNDLKDAGFTNIETVAIKDLKIGLLKSDGEVENISINGSNNIKRGSVYKKNVKIRIDYHTFPDKEVKRENKDGYNNKTNSTISVGGITFSIPDYWVENSQEKDGDSFTSVSYSPKDKESTAQLSIFYLSNDENDVLTKDTVEKITEKVITGADSYEITKINNKYINNYHVWNSEFDFTLSQKKFTGMLKLIENEKEKKIILVSLLEDQNSAYTYIDDFEKSISNIKDESSSSAKESKSEKKPKDTDKKSNDESSKTDNVKEPITVNNNKEFAEILKLSDWGDDKIKSFAKKYKGKKIEFDAVVYDLFETSDGKYNIWISAGDFYDEINFTGPEFVIITSIPDGMKFTDGASSLSVKNRIHIVAKIVGYDDSLCLFYITPVSTYFR